MVGLRDPVMLCGRVVRGRDGRDQPHRKGSLGWLQRMMAEARAETMQTKVRQS